MKPHPLQTLHIKPAAPAGFFLSRIRASALPCPRARSLARDGALGIEDLGQRHLRLGALLRHANRRRDQRDQLGHYFGSHRLKRKLQASPQFVARQVRQSQGGGVESTPSSVSQSSLGNDWQKVRTTGKAEKQASPLDRPVSLNIDLSGSTLGLQTPSKNNVVKSYAPDHVSSGIKLRPGQSITPAILA